MAEMTSLERVQAVLAGQMPDRVPVIPQGFMFSAKTAGYDIGAINRNPAKMAESHRISQEKYGYDGCVVDVDDATLAEACGAKVIFREQDVASVDEHHPVLEDLREIDDLKMPDPLKDGRICEWLETVERLKAAIGDHVFIMGRADQGPFSLLCLLRGTQEFMVDLLTEDEEVIRHALEWTTEAHTRFALAQLKAGAHATSMGDAYASPNLVSPDMYRDFAFPYEQKVVECSPHRYALLRPYLRRHQPDRSSDGPDRRQDPGGGLEGRYGCGPEGRTGGRGPYGQPQSQRSSVPGNTRSGPPAGQGHYRGHPR